MEDSSVLDRVVALEQKDAIRALISKYCYINDGLTEISGLSALFTDDARLVNPSGETVGRGEVVSYYVSVISRTDFARHHIMNQEIEFNESGSATHRAYFLAFVGRDGESHLVFGRYQDELRLTDDGWRFAVKKNLIDKFSALQQGWS